MTGFLGFRRRKWESETDNFDVLGEILRNREFVWSDITSMLWDMFSLG